MMALAPQPRSRPLPPPIIVIDPGHGGRDPGAIGAKGLRESDVVLTIGRKVCSLLDGLQYPQVRTILARDGDLPVGLRARAQLANDCGARLFLSLHCNSAADIRTTRDAMGNPLETPALDPRPSGYEVYAHPGATEACRLAERIVNSLGLRYPDRRNRGVKHATFAVLRLTQMPAVLVEIAFLSNPHEEAMLHSPLFLVGTAGAIARAILVHLRTEDNHALPKRAVRY